MAESYTVEAKFIANIDNYTRGIQEATHQMQGFEKQNISGSEQIKKSLSTIGKVTALAGAAITGMGVSALKSYGNFSNSMNQVAVIAGGTSKDIDGLTDIANKMGAQLPLSAQDCADAMIEMARAGASVEDIKDTFPAIATAATASGEDIQDTAGTVQVAMQIWKNSLDGAGQAAGILVEGANRSRIGLAEMNQAMSTVGPTAARLGYDMQDTVETIALMTNKGMSAAQASLDLNNALNRMTKPSNMAQAAMDELGISFQDASGNMKSIPQISRELNDAMAGMTVTQKNATLQTIFGAAGMKAMGIAMEANTKSTNDSKNAWDEYHDGVQKATKDNGTAIFNMQKQASEMQKNIGAKIEQVNGNWESLRNASMKSEEGVTGSMIDMINGTLGWVAESDSSIAKVGRAFVGLSPVIGPALTAASTLVIQFSNITKGAGTIAKMVTGPFRLMGKGLSNIAGSANSSQKAINASATANNSSAGSARQAGSAFSGFTGAVLKLGVGIGAATAGIGIMAVGIAALASTGTQGIVTTIALAGSIIAVTAAFALFAPALTAGSTGLIAFGIAMAGIGVGIGAASLGLAALILSFVQLTGVMNQIIPTMTNVGVGFASMIGGFLSKLLSFSPQITAAFTMMITSFSNAILTNAPIIISTLITLLMTFLQTVVANIGPIVNTFLQILVGFINAIATNIGPVIAALTNLLVQVVVAIGNNAGPILGAAVYAFGKITEALIQVMPLVIQILSALMIALVAILNDYIPAFNVVGGELMKALAAGVVGKKYDPIDKSSKAIKEAGDKASADGVKAFNNAGGNSAIAAAKAIASKSGNAKNAGSKVGQSGASGVSSQSGNARNSGSKVGSAAASGISSKSGNAKNSGSRVGQSGVSGISSKTGSARNAGSRLGSSAASAMNKSSSAHNAGNNVGAGFANGLSAQFGNIMRIAGGIANSVMRTIKHALSIHSPSRKMKEIGSYTGQGMLIGLQDQLRPITEIAGKMADAVMIDPQTTSLDYHLTPIADGIGSLNDGSLSMSLDGQSPQPAYINLNMGGDVFNTFVDDIQNRGGQRAQLKKGNSFR